MGRALWASLELDTLFNVAVAKLVNGSEDIFKPAMAIWAIRTTLSTNSDLMLSRDLLRSHMAVVVSLKYCNEAMYICYPSEPILALTARKILREDSKYKLIKFFDALLTFVLGRPIDKGRLLQSIFSQILLLAMDRAENVANNVDEISEIAVNGSFVQKNVLNVKSFILENEPSKNNIFDNLESIEKLFTKLTISEAISVTEADTRAPLPSPLSLNSNFYSHYHVSSVQSFLISLYGKTNFNSMQKQLPEKILSGLVNISHVISLDNSFPFKKVYPEEVFGKIQFTAAPDTATASTSTNPNSSHNLIDRVLLRYSFIRGAALKTPPGYYGIDLLIPVLLKREKKKINDVKVKDDIFTFIGVQYKSYYDSSSDVIFKMAANLHYVPCPKHLNCEKSVCDNSGCTLRTLEEDLNVIYNNQLTLYFAANRLTDTKLYKMEKFNYKKAKTSYERESKTKALENIHDLFIAENRVVTIDKQTCIVSSAINDIVDPLEKSHFLNTDGLYEKINQIIHCTEDPFVNSESYSMNTVANAVISLQPSVYPNANTRIRKERGLPFLPDLMKNSQDFLPDKVYETIQAYSKKRPASKTLETNPGFNSIK